MRHPSFAIAFAVVLATTLACSSTVAPTLVGTYALTLMGGASIPAPTMATSTDTIFADTITVRWTDVMTGLGEVEHRLVIRGLGSLPDAKTFVERFRREGANLIFIAPACPENADCFYAPRSGQLSSSEFRITFASSVFRDQDFARIK